MASRGITPSHRIRRFVRNRDSGFHPSNINYKWWLLATVMLGTFMAVLDATIVNVGLPKSWRLLASDWTKLNGLSLPICSPWLSCSPLRVGLPTNSVTNACTSTVCFSSRWGRSYAVFLTMSICLSYRASYKVWAGIIQPLGMAIITREFPPHQRGIAIGFGQYPPPLRYRLVL